MAAEKRTIVIAMSGGVDSSVAAALLKNAGHDVFGVTMCFSLPDSSSGRPVCCGPDAINDAKRVAGVLGISHYVLDFNDELKEKVIADFFSEYKRGRTPNPCVRCNELLKFDSLLKKSIAFGAELLATGHYARISGGESPRLQKAADNRKDQSYFLYRIRQEQLRKILFPLGAYTKDRVREMAVEFGLPVAEKPDSQEVCFIPDKETLDKLRLQAAPGSGPGPILDPSGKHIGNHNGAALYTIGQRRGLGVAAEHPLYVASIDVESNTIVAGSWDDIHKSEFTVRNLIYPADAPVGTIRLKVRIRHSHKEADATIIPGADETRVVFDEPQFAIAPGQSAVFYDGDNVAGGGIIDKVIS